MTGHNDVPPAWDERSVLFAGLDFARTQARAKCAGLSESDARRSVLPTSPLMTVSGIISHLRWVEHWWLEVVLHDRPDLAPWTDEDPDAEFAVTTPLDRLLAEYATQAAELNASLAGLDLDLTSVRRVRQPETTVSLRWILLHLIDETARHNGHLDIIRELLDGSVDREEP